MMKEMIDDPKWTNCTDKMPPDDDTEIIIRHIPDSTVILTPANEIWYEVDQDNLDDWEWTLYTTEIWKELPKWY